MIVNSNKWPLPLLHCSNTTTNTNKNNNKIVVKNFLYNGAAQTIRVCQIFNEVGGTVRQYRNSFSSRTCISRFNESSELSSWYSGAKYTQGKVIVAAGGDLLQIFRSFCHSHLTYGRLVGPDVSSLKYYYRFWKPRYLEISYQMSLFFKVC